MAAHSKFSQKLVDEICELIAGGMSLRNVCKRPGMPSRETVCQWLNHREEFRKAYSAAYVAQADSIEEEMAEIEGRLMRAKNPIDAQRAKVALSSMQWRAERRAPKKYGTKIQQEITGRDGGPVVIAGAPTDADL